LDEVAASKAEEVLRALPTPLQTSAGATVERDCVLPEKIPGSGIEAVPGPPAIKSATLAGSHGLRAGRR
jgi:hypothetical protein